MIKQFILSSDVKSAGGGISEDLAAASPAPYVREVVRRLEMISHFQRGGTEG
jgi:hypothetical protein